MKHRILWGLVVLNVLLAVTLAMRWGGGQSAAMAQVHRPSEYLMIPGEVSGGATAVVYLIDTSNGWLGAIAFDDARKELNVMPPIDLNRSFDTAPARGPNGAAPGKGSAPAAGGAH